MSVLWIIAFLMLVCSIVWLLCRSSKEGFATWEDMRNFFHYQKSPLENPAGIPYTPGPGISDVLSKVDSAFETSGFPKQVQSLFARLMDTSNPNATKAEKCWALGHPRLLAGTRGDTSITDAGEQSGCGWLFFSDPSTPSVGAYGYGPTSTNEGKRGQVYDASQYAVGGTFIWDTETAIRKEGIKRCRQIQTCSLLSAVDGCGFCPFKGHAVPVTSAGAVKYTTQEDTDPDNDGSCPTAVVLKTADCPVRTLNPRVFTGDFDYDINGNPIRNDLYLSVKNPQSTQIEDPCKLVDGQLPKACRQNMCVEIAHCVENKGLHRIVTNGATNVTDELAVYYIKRRGGVDIPASFWLPSHPTLPPGAAAPGAAPPPGAGTGATGTTTGTTTGTGTGTTGTVRHLTKTEAEDLLNRLNSLATSGKPSMSRSAALWLLNETPFNPCDFQDTDTGPYPLQCLQREFRKVGCQASGSAYPSGPTVASYDDKSYKDIRTDFVSLYQSMNRDVKNVREQDETIEQCLGIQVKRTDLEIREVSPNMCREQGTEFWFTTIPNIGQRLLYDRRIFTPTSGYTLKDINGALNLKGGVRGFTQRSYVELSGTPVRLDLTVPNRFYSLWINQAQVLPTTGTGGLVFQYSFPMYQRSEMEIRYESGQGVTRLPTMTLTPPVPLYLAQSAWKPVVSLQARAEGFTDDNYFLQIPVQARKTRQHGDRWGIPIDGSALLSEPARGLWLSAARTITCMVYWSGFSGQALLWRMDQGSGGASDTVLTAQVIGNRVVVSMTSGTSVFRMESTVQLSNPNNWLHVAVVIGARLADTKIYINSVNRTPASDATVANGTIALDGTWFSRTVLGGPGFTGSVGWFHIYTTALSELQVQRDERYDDRRLAEMEDVVIVQSRK